MITEILSCLSLLTGDIDYGNPKVFPETHIFQDKKRSDIFYISTSQDHFQCVSSVPLNQNVKILFSKPIQGLPAKIQYIESPTPKEEDSQKEKKQVYKLTPKKLFKHEKINTFSTPAFSEVVASANCETIKKNSPSMLSSYEESLIKIATLEISDTLADWSEYMDAEDYGYDKSAKEREKSKRLYTEKLKHILVKCQKSPDLDLAIRNIIVKLDLYLAPIASNSTKVLNLKTQSQKTSVPANK